MSDLQMITRDDLDGVGIDSGNAEEGELPQPAMTLAQSPDGTERVLVTTKHFRADLARLGWIDAEAPATEPAKAPATRKPAGQ